MTLTVTIAGVDRTAYIDWPTFSKEDVLNSQVDTCVFETKKYGSKNWKPAVGNEITVLDGSTKIFAGVIVTVSESIEGALLKYSVQCKDWTHYLDRVLVAEVFTAQTVNQIISFINTNYLTGFTISHVSCAITVNTITFNRLPVSKCLDILAQQVNYSWYPDYDKDLHFFAKNSEAAPFSLTDTNGNYINSSLNLTDDISQMRNRVLIRGGEMIGSSQTKNLTGDGTNKTFPLGFKFATLPTVTVGGASKTVGVEFIDKDTDYDCLWNFNEKYLRFPTAPAGSAAIVATGTPLIPILVQVQDDASITQYGAYEFTDTNKTIASKEEAKQYAISQLDAYAAKVQEGNFETYQSGLRSGQIITIQSDLRGISSTGFLIQRVSLSMRTPTDGTWTVELATLRTMGIIAFLQQLLLDQNQQITVASSEVLEKYYLDNQNVQVTEEIGLYTEVQDWQNVQVAEQIRKDPWTIEFVLAPYTPVNDADNKREMILDVSSYVY